MNNGCFGIKTGIIQHTKKINQHAKKIIQHTKKKKMFSQIIIIFEERMNAP
jgi:hypothetical protein